MYALYYRKVYILVFFRVFVFFCFSLLRCMSNVLRVGVKTLHTIQYKNYIYESALLPTSCIAYLWGNTYEQPHCAINALYVAFVIICENQELISLKLHNFVSLYNIINSEGNRVDGGKLVQPAIPRRVCFRPAIRERLPTPIFSMFRWSHHKVRLYSRRFAGW